MKVINKHKIKCFKCGAEYIYEVEEEIETNQYKIYAVCKKCNTVYNQDINNITEYKDKSYQVKDLVYVDRIQ